MTRKYHIICVCFSKYKKQKCTIIIDKQYNIHKIIHNRKHVCHFNLNSNLNSNPNPHISS